MTLSPQKLRKLQAELKAGVPEPLSTYLDGLDCSTDGRGWDAKHEAAKEQLYRCINNHEALYNFVSEVATLEMRGNLSGYDLMIAAARNLKAKVRGE